MSVFEDHNDLLYCGDCSFLHQPSGVTLGHNLNPIGTKNQKNECTLDLFNVQTYKKERLESGIMVTKRPFELGKEFRGISLNRGPQPKKTTICLALAKHIHDQLVGEKKWKDYVDAECDHYFDRD